MAPFYAYFLAAVYAVLGADSLTPLYFQIFFGTVSCLLIFLLTDKYFSRKAAYAALLISALYPVFIFYDVVLLKENLMVLFILLFALVYPLDAKEPQPRWTGYFLGGLFTAISSLMRANIFLLLPFLLFFEYKRNKGMLLRNSLIFALGLFIVIFPVALRNKIAGGEWVITVAEGGMNFWTGNNPNSNGAYVGADFIRSEEPEFEDEDFRAEASKRTGRELSLKEASDYWYAESFRFISSQPARFAHLLYRKFIGFIHKTELPSDLNFYFARDFSYTLRWDIIHFGIIFPFAAAGMLFARKKSPANYIFLSIIAANLLSSLIFFNSSRYRLPAVPFIIIYCGYFISAVIDSFEKNKNLKTAGRAKTRAQKPSLWPYAAVIVPLFVLSNYKDTIYEGIAAKRVNYINASTFYFRAGNYSKAEEMLKRCLEIDPSYALAYERYAVLLDKTGRKEEAGRYLKQAAEANLQKYDPRASREMSSDQRAYALYKNKQFGEALKLFKELLAKNPQSAKELRNNIGLCYMELNEFDKARASFESSLAIDPSYDKAFFNMGLLSERSGNLLGALEYYNKALAINPEYKKAKQKIALIYQNLGKK